MAVDEVEFREFFTRQYVRLCWLGLLLTGDQAEGEELAEVARLLGLPSARSSPWPWPRSPPGCSPAAP